MFSWDRMSAVAAEECRVSIGGSGLRIRPGLSLTEARENGLYFGKGRDANWGRGGAVSFREEQTRIGGGGGSRTFYVTEKTVSYGFSKDQNDQKA